MAKEMKEGEIVVFRNNDKKSEKHPVFKGRAMVNGQLMYVSLWVRTHENTGAYFSGQIQPPKEQTAKPATEDSIADITTPTKVNAVEEAQVITSSTDDLPF